MLFLHSLRRLYCLEVCTDTVMHEPGMLASCNGQSLLWSFWHNPICLRSSCTDRKGFEGSFLRKLIIASMEQETAKFLVLAKATHNITEMWASSLWQCQQKTFVGYLHVHIVGRVRQCWAKTSPAYVVTENVHTHVCNCIRLDWTPNNFDITVREVPQCNLLLWHTRSWPLNLSISILG